MNVFGNSHISSHRISHENNGKDLSDTGSTSQRLSTLSNGMRVVTDNISHVETVMIGLWVQAGARHERPEQNGLAHFLEHMTFKGTPTRSAQAIAREIEELGGHMNASTSYEQTTYYVRMLAEDIKTGLDIIADVLQNSCFAAEEVEKERQVILQEIARTNDAPDDLVFDIFQEQAFPKQSIGRPILGTTDLVKGYTSDDFRTFINTHYHPERMVIAAAGAVDHDVLTEQCERLLGSWQAQTATVPEAAHYQGGARWVQRPVDQIHLVLGHPAPHKRSQDRYALRMLSYILGGGMSSRLFQKIREEHGMVYAIQSLTDTFNDTGLLATYAGTTANLAEKMLHLMGQEIGNVVHTITDSELQRARKQMRAGMKMGLESTSARAGRMVAQLEVEGKLVPISDIEARINAVTREDLSQLAEKIFAEPPTLVVVGADSPNLRATQECVEKLSVDVRNEIASAIASPRM